MFYGCILVPDSEETKFGSRDQEAFPSAGKNTRAVLVPCHAWKGFPTVNSNGVDFSVVPVCHILQQMSSEQGSQKLLQGLVSHELTAYFSIFNQFKLNELWPYYQKHVNQIILNRTTL